MVTITDLMDPELLKQMVAEHFVVKRRHPSLPLHIYNYTAKAQYEWRWNEATEQCRGLIATEDGTVLARPMRKFFSIDQLGSAGVSLPDEPFEAYEKVDGSLIVLYHHDGAWHTASRGSFVSDQARWATDILATYRERFFAPDPSITYCMELVHPENRIVVDYGDAKQLKLLAMFETETGAEYDLKESDFPSRARRYGFDSVDALIDALETDPRFAGQEGFVLRYASGLRVKVKSSEYLHLHRLVSRVSPKRIWEYLADDQPIDRLVHGLWSEPADWIKERAGRLQDRFTAVKVRSGLAYREALDVARSPDGAIDRKAFAAHVMRDDRDIAPILFALLDDKPEAVVQQMIWKKLKPSGDEVFRPEGEDA